VLIFDFKLHASVGPGSSGKSQTLPLSRNINGGSPPDWRFSRIVQIVIPCLDTQPDSIENKINRAVSNKYTTMHGKGVCLGDMAHQSVR
jgi:hypothetical protein